MFKLLFFNLLFYTATIVSIYSLSVTDVDSNNISFNSFRGKKILIVNTASSSNQVSQLNELQQLYLQHQDSLVVIAFPSNSFGNEPKNDLEIKSFMQASHGVSFPIVAKSWVTGDSANVVYRWLSEKMQNDVTNARAKTDFQKFLIDNSGFIVAKFDSSVSPLSTLVQNAIHNN